MKPFEFVLIIISIIMGLAFAELANSTVFMIKNYKTIEFSFPYFSLLLTGATGGLNYWASIYMARNVQLWNNQKVSLMFLTSLTYYAVAGVFFPDSKTFNGNFKELYHEVFDVTLVMILCWLILIVLESYVYKKGRTERWYGTMVLFIAIVSTGIFIGNKTYREILSFILLGLQLLNLVMNKIVIEEK